MKQKRCTLIISTYNWPGALAMCMQSVFEQTVLPTEIIIADDGSTDETKQLIASLKENTPVPIKHIWHKDDGFRKTIILNEAVRVSNTEYIIQIDGDIILNASFIKDHLNAMKAGHFLRGSRTLINEKTTEALLKNKSIDIHFFSAGLYGRLNGLRSPALSALYGNISKPDFSTGVIGCNFSYFKKDFIAVNGYNNDMIGWGQEDSELGARLMNNGIIKKILKYKAICFHLFHNHYSRERDDINKSTLQQVIENKIMICTNGFNNQHEVTVW